MYYEINNCMYDTKLPVGAKIKFKREKQKYTVISSNIMFAVCTKPFNAKKTVLYTVIDFWNEKRGAENLVFGMGAEDKKQCDEMLERLTNGESEVTSRNFVDLDIEDLILPKNKNHE